MNPSLEICDENFDLALGNCMGKLFWYDDLSMPIDTAAHTAGFDAQNPSNVFVWVDGTADIIGDAHVTDEWSVLCQYDCNNIKDCTYTPATIAHSKTSVFQ